MKSVWTWYLELHSYLLDVLFIEHFSTGFSHAEPAKYQEPADPPEDLTEQPPDGLESEERLAAMCGGSGGRTGPPFEAPDLGPGEVMIFFVNIKHHFPMPLFFWVNLHGFHLLDDLNR